MPALIEKVPGFKKHIREFIVQTLASTFQSVKRESMEQSLDLVRDIGRRIGSGSPNPIADDAPRLAFAESIPFRQQRSS